MLLKMNAALTYELYEYERNWCCNNSYIAKALIHHNSLLTKVWMKPPNSILEEEIVSFDTVVKCWLICYVLLHKIGIVTYELPAAEMETSLVSSFAIGSNNTQIIPCLVQFAQQQRVEPPVQLYFVKDGCNLILAKPDPHALGKCIIVLKKALFRLEVSFHSELNVVDMIERTVKFTDNYRCNPGMILNYGFVVVEDYRKDEWRCRLIFPGANTYAEATNWLQEHHDRILKEWVSSMENILTLN
jgi:hypothetical protein